jgi:sugar lactone lactonase YvrE
MKPATCLALLALLLPSAGQATDSITSCEPKGDITPLCQFRNPEDIVALPDQRTLLVSQMGNMEGTEPGSLVFFDTATSEVQPAYPAGTHQAVAADWGTPDCPGEPDNHFAPHGLSLQQRHDGQWQLAVINHGGRETVEMFELQSQDGRFSLVWRGCVVPAEGTWMNDLALMRDGGFVASHMFDKRAPHLFGMSTGLLKALLGFNTGYVFEWLPGGKTRILEGSRGPFLNGVALSPDESTVFANISTGKALRRLDRASGTMTGSVAIRQPDNLSWDKNGKLLTAGVTASLAAQQSCSKHHGETCAAAFAIYRIDPVTLQSEVILQQEGAPMGAGTVAQPLGDSLYIGSYTGNRILRVPYR